MSKILTIVRHGKSDWNHELPDFDRPLKQRAYSDAYKMAQELLKLSAPPDLLYSSPANRAAYTAVMYARTLQRSFDKIRFDETVYHAGPDNMLSLIKGMDNSLEHIAVFGHNPGFTSLANHFLPQKISNLPTSSYVWLKFDCNNWKEIDSGCLTKHEFNYPSK